MAYQIFERKTPRMGSPVLSFSKLGAVTFNQTAARLLKQENIKNVLVMWDPDSRKIALKPTKNENDIRSYTIRYNDKGNGASFSAKTFLDYAGVNYSRRKALPIEINPKGEFIVEVALPDTFFEKREEFALPVAATVNN